MGTGGQKQARRGGAELDTLPQRLAQWFGAQNQAHLASLEFLKQRLSPACVECETRHIWAG